MVDCKLFIYSDSLYSHCITGAHSIYIGKLLWSEEKINGRLEIVAYLDSKSNANLPESLHLKELNSNNMKNVEKKMEKYEKKMYSKWELHFLVHNYIYHDIKTFDDILRAKVSYDVNAGFIHLKESNELLGIGHIHSDFYNFMEVQRPFGIKGATHYLHFFYTIADEPPFRVKRMSDKFCFVSPYKNTEDCDVIQFVMGMIESTLNNTQYLFVSYGINDCIGSIAKLEKQFVIDMLK